MTGGITRRWTRAWAGTATTCARELCSRRVGNWRWLHSAQESQRRSHGVWHYRRPRSSPQGGGSSPDPPCVAVTLLAIPPLACRRPRARPRAPTPFTPPLGGARRSPPLPASAAAAKFYPPLSCYTMSGASAYAFASYSKWQRIPRVQELSK